MGLPILFARKKKKFNPLSLFAAGEQGVWYDPSDWTTLFQDSAGTTPVTAIEQPVGLILDKSGRGNHASQPTTTSRPILRNLYNQFQYTEQFDNAAWTKFSSSIAQNSTIAPDGTLTADTITNTATGGAVYQTQSIVAGTKTTIFIALKRGNTDWARVQHTDGTTNAHWVFVNLSTGALGSNSSVGTVSDTSYAISNLGDGWYRVTVSGILGSSTAAGLLVRTAQSDGSVNAIVNGTVVVWGASLVPTNESSLPYQRVAANTLGSGVYDTDLTKFKPYLFFDGSDDWLQTGNIDFSASNKMSVFTGVRKLSDSQQRIIAELSATIASNNGAFMLSAPNSAAANYNFSSNGTSQVANTVTTYAAPITNVVTGLADISGPNNTIRINGAATPLTTSQGTGNYGTYPLYIGRRGGTTLPLSGRIYSLIIRGALTSSPQLEQTETWVAGKTGVTL